MYQILRIHIQSGLHLSHVNCMKDTYIVELREHISKKKRPYPSTVEDFTIVSQTPPPPTPLSWIHLFSLHSTRNSIFRRNSSVFMSLLVYIMHFIHRIYTEGLKHALYSYWIITGRECGWGWNKWNQELLEMKSSSELTITTILTKRNFKSTHLLIFILASYYLY